MAQGIKRLEIARRCDRGNRRWKYIFAKYDLGVPTRNTCGDGDLSLQSRTAATATLATVGCSQTCAWTQARRGLTDRSCMRKDEALTTL